MARVSNSYVQRARVTVELTGYDDKKTTYYFSFRGTSSSTAQVKLNAIEDDLSFRPITRNRVMPRDDRRHHFKLELHDVRLADFNEPRPPTRPSPTRGAL